MNNQKNFTILPCPFCGGKAGLVKTTVFWVRCQICGSEHGYSSRIRQKAVDNWNKRIKW
jgi:transcription elongation factor Elf1